MHWLLACASCLCHNLTPGVPPLYSTWVQNACCLVLFEGDGTLLLLCLCSAMPAAAFAADSEADQRSSATLEVAESLPELQNRPESDRPR